MSHTTALRGVAIRSASAIATAVASMKIAGLNVELLTDAKPRMYYQNQHGKCPFVLNVKDAPYDVGFDQQTDGTYAPVFDEWAGHIGKAIGVPAPAGATPEQRAQSQIGRFLQPYTEAATIEAAVAQGYMVGGSHTDADGNVHLMLTGM